MLSPASFLAAALAFSSAPTNPSVPVSRDQILEMWGWKLAQEKNLNGVDLSAGERAVFLAGFTAGTAGQPSPTELRKTYFAVQQLAKARHEKQVRAVTRQNEAAAAAYMGLIETNAGFLALPNRVWCEILRPGGTNHPQLQQTINVHYTARLQDGTEFSQMGPVDMVLVTNRDICRGWSEALQRIGPGGALKLVVPPPLAEAEAEVFGIEPGSLMIFDAELFAVTNTSPEDLASALLPPAPAPPPPPAPGCTDLQLIQTWGWLTERESHADKFALTPGDVAEMIKGMTAGMAGAPPAGAAGELDSLVDQFVAGQQEKADAKVQQQRRTEREALFADLQKNTNVIALPDGLRYEILRPGTGPFPRPTQRVTVRYTGRLINGTVFDSTEIGPLDIDLDKVIRGWSEGVQKINAGGRIKLYIPPDLAYRDQATSGIPANSTLIFDIELLQIKDGEPAGSPSALEKQ